MLRARRTVHVLCENGLLAVVDVEDGQVLAYCTGGLILDVHAKTLPSLVDWTVKEARLGQPKLSGPGKDADPLLVLTAATLHRIGSTDEDRVRHLTVALPPR